MLAWELGRLLVWGVQAYGAYCVVQGHYPALLELRNRCCSRHRLILGNARALLVKVPTLFLFWTLGLHNRLLDLLPDSADTLLDTVLVDSPDWSRSFRSRTIRVQKFVALVLHAATGLLLRRATLSSRARQYHSLVELISGLR